MMVYFLLHLSVLPSLWLKPFSESSDIPSIWNTPFVFFTSSRCFQVETRAPGVSQTMILVYTDASFWFTARDTNWASDRDCDRWTPPNSRLKDASDLEKLSKCTTCGKAQANIPWYAGLHPANPAAGNRGHDRRIYTWTSGYWTRPPWSAVCFSRAAVYGTIYVLIFEDTMQYDEVADEVDLETIASFEDTWAGGPTMFFLLLNDNNMMIFFNSLWSQGYYSIFAPYR